MPDAALVWNTWRRILRDDALVALATRDGRPGDPALPSLGSAEGAIVADYAATPQATRTNVGMYRRGLVRLARVALGRVPLSQRLLDQSGLDPDAVAADFTRVHGYADDGPHLWRLAGAFVAYLATRSEFAAPALQDVLAVDQALVALALRLGHANVDAWPDAAASDHAPGFMRFVASQAALVVRSQYDLTAWIENPYGYASGAALPHSARHWLIYFPDAGSAPAYAALSERSAQVFALLATPHSAAGAAVAIAGLSAADAMEVIGRLAAIGVVRACGIDRDAFVMLDPAVAILDVAVAGHGFLLHGQAEVGMTVPPGDGLLGFVAGLAGQPVQVSSLRSRFDDPRLVDTMLGTLLQHGFLHVTPPTGFPAPALAASRRACAHRRQARLCQTIDVQLDAASGATQADMLCGLVAEHSVAPQLQLRCGRLDQHGSVLAQLAGLRTAGRLGLHHAVVRVTDPACDADIARSLRRLGAEVIVDIAWPAPVLPVSGVDVLVRAGVPVYAHQAPGAAFFDTALRARALAWAASSFLCGLYLTLEAHALWPAQDGNEADFAAVFETVLEMGHALGDVCIMNLTDDEVLLGNQYAARPEELADMAARFRHAYARWRLPLLKSFEGDNTFSQTPEAEEKLVRLEEDLLPNQPALLKLAPGSLVVDVCGGNGRVARRLAPLVGVDGLIVSVEMFRCVSARARRFASQTGVTNVQCRTGLAQRISLPDGAADAAVNEWTGAIWELGLGAAMVAEMARVVRPGGRIAVTHRLVRLALHRLGSPWIQFDDIYALMRAAFAHPHLTVVGERIWGQTVSSLVGERASAWRKHYLPRIVNPFDVTYTEDQDPGPHADVCLTVIAERTR